MPVLDTRTLPTHAPGPGWHARFFRSGAMSFAYYAIDADASLHEHSHPNEEVWNVLSGELEITIGGDTYRAGAGAAAIVPPNTAHSVRALAASVVIVVDQGVRADVGGGERAAFSIEFLPSAGGEVPFEIHNHGRGEGIVRQIAIVSGFIESLSPPTRTEIPTAELPHRITIAGGATLRGSHARAPMNQSERDALRDGTRVFQVRGAVYYEDARGERHHTTFCRVLDPERGFVRPNLPGYNYGD
jgi:hypothetical protein